MKKIFQIIISIVVGIASFIFCVKPLGRADGAKMTIWDGILISLLIAIIFYFLIELFSKNGNNGDGENYFTGTSGAGGM